MKQESNAFELMKSKICPNRSWRQRFISSVILLIVFLGTITAQTNVTGKVLDSEGEPLPGVSITTNNSKVSSITDINGNFILNVPKDVKVTTISFTFIGMKKETIAYQGKPLRVIMKSDTQIIDEVVVTGIFERKKEGFTGSANRMTKDQIRSMTSGNVLKAIEMLDPGFRMNSNNLSGSNPSSVPDFTMRGQSSMGNYSTNETVIMRGDIDTRPNQPLFVLDGIIGVSVSKIIDLDPELIESITLLKDAAAMTIYGSQASNGVVVVETRAPAEGKLRVSYNGNYKLEYPDLSVYNLLDAKDKLEIESRAGFYNEYYTAETSRERLEIYRQKLLEVKRGVNTYWLSQPVQTAFAHRHGVNLEGGSEALRYKLYVGANFAPGVMKQTGVNAKNVSLDIRYRYKGILISNVAYVDYTISDRTSPYGSFDQYTQLNPYYRIYGENGEIKKSLENRGEYTGANVGNPMYNTLYNTLDRNTAFEVRDAFRLEYRPIENLRLAMDLTVTKTTSDLDQFKSGNHTDFISEIDFAEKGKYTWTNSTNLGYDLSFTASYNKVFKNVHVLSAFFRYNVNEKTFHEAGVYSTGFPNDNMDEVFLGAKAKATSGSESTTRSLGAVTTLNYTYDERYAVDINGRLDASSQFGKNNKFAPFWSTGVRWNANKEEWIKKSKVISELIFRATYGITGTQDFSPYQSLQMYNYSGSMRIYRGSDVVGAMLYGMGNPNLKWQTTNTFNAGVDINLFNSLISGRFEYYYKYTKNTVLDFSLPPSVGFSSVKDNLGNISNKGYEVTLRIMPYNNLKKQLNFNFVVTGSHNENKIDKISNALRSRNNELLKEYSNSPNKISRPLPRYEEGYSQSMIWAIQSLGIDPATGREIFQNRQGERTGEWNAVDLMPVADAEPKLEGALSANLNWRGLSLTIAARYKYGGYMYNTTLVDKIENADLHYNVDKRAFTERWLNPGDLASYKAISSSAYGASTKASTRFIMKNNELVLNTINLQYRFERRYNPFIKKLGLTNASVGLYLEDLFHFSTIKVERGTQYPMSRQVSLSLSLMF